MDNITQAELDYHEERLLYKMVRDPDGRPCIVTLVAYVRDITSPLGYKHPVFSALVEYPTGGDDFFPLHLLTPITDAQPQPTP